MATEFHIKQGDLLPELEATMVYASGAAINLTGGSVAFHVKDSAGNVVLNKAATIVTPASGAVKYTWAAGDTNTAGIFEAEFEATLSGKTITSPNSENIRLYIHEAIA